MWNCWHFSELNTQQLYDILALRQEVFVVEQDCPYQDADGLDFDAWHICVYDEGHLVAYTRILKKGVTYDDYASIGRVITSMRWRGKGKGRELMQYSIDKTKTLLGDGPIKISAQSHLEKYYASLGFKPTGEEYLEDGIPHMGMVLYEF